LRVVIKGKRSIGESESNFYV